MRKEDSAFRIVHISQKKPVAPHMVPPYYNLTCFIITNELTAYPHHESPGSKKNFNFPSISVPDEYRGRDRLFIDGHPCQPDGMASAMTCNPS
ncbi:hypothetical protein CEXT_342431 [Caerostris extrusa]|uniref:Uncharacterized protein n=1 Tax=Caerostris extrusa TaxID=172846 RepID=A0AAV4WD83_CAEEX|nr:hypothetical protein CEXT_342431 [Caerostris extrusa]